MADIYSPNVKHIIKQWLVGPRGFAEHKKKYDRVISHLHFLRWQKNSVAYLVDIESLPRLARWNLSDIRNGEPPYYGWDTKEAYEREWGRGNVYLNIHKFVEPEVIQLPRLEREVTAQNDD